MDPQHSIAARPRHVAHPSRLLPLAALVLLLPPRLGLAYDWPTHQAISNIALRRPDCTVDDYLKNQLLLPQGFLTTSGGNTIAQRLEDGARDEDEQNSTRPRNHFFNPIDNSGLHDDLILTGGPSLQWAWDHPDNQQDWHAARDAYFRFFTGASKNDRLQGMSDAFFDLGHVIHLIQDLGQPQHTRNDAHLTVWPGPGAPYEDYCAAHYSTPDQVASLGNVGIPSLQPGPGPFANIPNSFSGFWDSGQFTGQDGFGGFSTPPGLAEYSNAYFLTDDTMFGTFQLGVLPRAGGPPLQVTMTSRSGNHSTSAQHRFVNPRLADTDLASFFAPATTHVTVRRTGEGTPNAAHYLTLRARDGAGNVVHTTTNLCLLTATNDIGFDNTTYQSYAEQLIPMAVSYSSGLLNYFFRGKLDIEVRWIEAQQQYTIKVTNRSGSTMGAGSWTLYQDDSGDNRSPIGATFNYPGTLADGGSFTGTFAATNRTGGYTIVFHGTLGDENDWAVVGKRFELVRVLITWDPKSDQDLYMWGPDGSLIGYYSKVSSYGELDNDNIGGTGPENITLKDMREGTYQFMIDYYRDWWKEYNYDPPSQTCIPNDPPLNVPEDYGYDPCFDPTAITVTVKTYHNSSVPVRTQTQTVTFPDYGYYLPGPGMDEGQVDEAWSVVQTVTVDADRNVTVTGTAAHPAPTGSRARPVARVLAPHLPPLKDGVPPVKPVTTAPVAAQPMEVK